MGIHDRDWYRQEPRADGCSPRAFRADFPPRSADTPWWVIALVCLAFFAVLYLGFSKVALPHLGSSRVVQDEHMDAAPLPEPHPDQIAETPPAYERPSMQAPVGTQTWEAPKPANTTIYFCKSYSGGTFWSSAHCSAHNALIDRMVTVPTSISFEQQVHLGENARQQGEALLKPPAQPQQQVTSINKPDVDCTAMSQEIASLDAMARQPQSAGTQD